MAGKRERTDEEVAEEVLRHLRGLTGALEEWFQRERSRVKLGTDTRDSGTRETAIPES